MFYGIHCTQFPKFRHTVKIHCALVLDCLHYTRWHCLSLIHVHNSKELLERFMRRSGQTCIRFLQNPTFHPTLLLSLLRQMVMCPAEFI